MKKHVLFVSYVFPPIGGAGVQRIIKFVKYLGEFDWQTSVVTVANPSVPLNDNSLLADIPQAVEVFKTKTFEPGYQFKAEAVSEKSETTGKVSFSTKLKSFVKNIARLILLPDPQVLWWPSTSFFLYKYLKNNKVDVIFSSGPPFSNLVLAVFWGKIFKIPVVSDFRDEWSFSRNNWENLPKFKIIKWIDKRLEKFVVKNSAYITVASPAYERTMRNNYRIDNCITITNGYDRDDFDLNEQLTVDLEEGKINLVYSGTVWSATTLQPFIQALENVIETQPELKDEIRLNVIGRVVPEEEHYFEPLVKMGVIRMLGYIDHDLLVQSIKVADILLLSLAEIDGSEKIIPGKIFEYMMCNAPVISTVPAGACSDIISKIKGFYVATPFDRKQIENHILQAVKEVQSGNVYQKEGISNYSRKNLTDQLASVLASAIRKH